MNGKRKTKLTLENAYGTYSIEINGSDLDITEMVEQVIKPVLLSATYAPETIAEAFPDIDEMLSKTEVLELVESVLEDEYRTCPYVIRELKKRLEIRG